jgi:hypothetical protein
VNDTTRPAFEAYFAASRKSKGVGKRPTFHRLPDGTYSDDHTQRHWWTWQNALAAQAPAAEPLTDERAVLRHVATLAHEGGLSKLNEHGVMCEIRRLSMPYWDTSGNHDAAMARVNAALTAAKL